MTSTLKSTYINEIVPKLCETRGFKNRLQAPRLRKVVVNMGIDTGVDKDTFKAVTEDLAKLTGQKPIITKAHKSISNFKLREGMPVGAKVTLRGVRMFDFLERLIHVILPRIRDFRGVPLKSFDGQGNYSLGIKEQSVFPEINPDHIKKSQGMDITIVTTEKEDEHARELLTLLGMPFAHN
ncbi:MAG: 50S ribosomal protein L5 [Kiritimatiellae bacterium]|nr:50S ribosomal protein L5 [Kiritimatiellia bacterium]